MGVPTHRVEIRKHIGAVSWANDYLIEAMSMDLCEQATEELIDFERSIHYNHVIFDNARMSTMQIGDRNFRHAVINAPGLSDAGGSDFLPLYCTLRLDMETNDSDPCRKYYRVPVPEALQANGIWSPAHILAISALFPPRIAAFPDGVSIVSNKGHIVINGSFHGMVQMRQLHRHKKKKSTGIPVFP